jgi:porin
MRISVVIAFTCLASVAAPSRAEKSLEISAAYTADLSEVVPASGTANGYYLDNLDLLADANLESLIGWSGGTFHAHVLNNLGGRPNDRAGTLQGVDNIEVATHRLRLFEAWIEQKIGASATIRAGLYDLNSEFYSNDAAGLLLAPAFGVGSEISATGPNGPSIFPSTALAVRAEIRTAGSGFVRTALLNAEASTLGDEEGVDTSFRHGALLIGEAGIEGDKGKLALGLWGYSQRQDDVRALDAAGQPLQRAAHGVYLLADRPLTDADKPRAVTAFVRGGVSDGKTTPFRGGWQAGLLVGHVWDYRPDSQFSIGANQGYLSHGFRRNLQDQGIATVPAESAVEITYADKIGGHVTLQPDAQLILNSSGYDGIPATLYFGLRITLES